MYRQLEGGGMETIMKEENCIFCKIVAGKIPSVTLYEDEDFRVILDLGLATRDYALLISKAQL